MINEREREKLFEVHFLMYVRVKWKIWPRAKAIIFIVFYHGILRNYFIKYPAHNIFLFSVF
jgi:hypothetical protein